MTKKQPKVMSIYKKVVYWFSLSVPCFFLIILVLHYITFSDNTILISGIVALIVYFLLWYLVVNITGRSVDK